MITKICVSCGSRYKCKKYLSDKRKYCSRACYDKAQKGSIPWNKGMKYKMPQKQTGWNITCIVCGKEKYYQLNEHKKRKRVYCSPACYHIDRQKEELSYSGLHTWIKRQRGKAQKCEWCGDDKTIDWANKSHKYKKDLDDWIALCRKHHIQYDKNYKFLS